MSRVVSQITSSTPLDTLGHSLGNLGVLVSGLLGSTKTTSTTGGDKTDLSSCDGVSLDGGRLTNVLMVTSSVRMFNGVHSHTTNLGPAVSFRFVFVVGISGLEKRFVAATSSSDYTNHCSASRGDCFLGSRWKTDLCPCSLLWAITVA